MGGSRYKKKSIFEKVFLKCKTKLNNWIKK